MNERLRPQKRLSQNFLINRGVQQRIIRACNLKQDDFVFEIGPGKGALTKDILSNAGAIWAIERDLRCVNYLKKHLADERLTIINEDVLAFCWETLPKKIKVIGNLPYHISSPILEKIIQHRANISECFLMTQLEFAQRLLAKTHTKHYGSLSCYTQLYMDGKILFKVRNTSFYPPPKVTSALIHFKILPQPRYRVNHEHFLFEMIRQGFSHRRKMLIKNLKVYNDNRQALEEIFDSVSISTKARAEDCSLEQFVQLANILDE